MDTVYISDLRVDTVIGIYDWERTIRQSVSIDLEMGTDIRYAASTDDISDTLDYNAVAKRITAFVSDSEFELVEKLAEAIAQLVISEFKVDWLSLKLSKLGAVKNAEEVGVVIERIAKHYQPRAYVGIGSNQNALVNIKAALCELAEHFGDLTQSTAHKNPAIGFDGSDFINVVVGFNTELDAKTLTQTLQKIEHTLGRDRNLPKFAARCIDIDLLLLGDEVTQSNDITLPHPDILTYPFVLAPLAELIGNAVHPIEGRSYQHLWDNHCKQRMDLKPIAL